MNVRLCMCVCACVCVPRCHRVAALGSAFTGELNTCEVESYLLSTSDPLFEAGRGAHATPQQQQQQQQQQRSGATLQSPKIGTTACVGGGGG